MNISLPIGVKYILNVLHDNGYEAFVIGGCTRDAILNNTPHDWDITTNATPDTVEWLFSITYPTGKQYGTITVGYVNDKGDQTNYEVTTFRGEQNYKDGRRPSKVWFSKKLKNDVKRRDFTINQIAYNENGFIDYYNGIQDLNNKILRTVGNPYKRFKEDYLRLIRALRFAAKYNLTIDTQTTKAIHKLFTEENLKHISVERIHDEIIKMTPYIVKNHYIRLEFQQELKILYGSNCNLYLTSDNPYICLAGWYKGTLHLATLPSDILNRLRYSTNEKKLIHKLQSCIFWAINSETGEYLITQDKLTNKYYVLKKNLYLFRRLFYKADIDIARLMIEVLWLCCHINFDIDLKLFTSQMLKFIDEQLKNCRKMGIDGNYIKANFNVQGKIIGDILNKCELYILENPDKNTQKDLHEFVYKYMEARHETDSTREYI